MVRRLGLGTFTAVVQVQSLVGELRFHKPDGTAKKNLKRLLIGEFCCIYFATIKIMQYT